MIRMKVSYKKDTIKSITFEGHALYDNYGKDIVCASVSATYLCTINAIYAIKEDSIEVISTKEKQIINVQKENQTVQILLQNMIRCLTSLEKQYPKNIKLDKEEK